jgi:hypothetical protein
MPRIYPFGSIHVELKYLYKRSVGEHVDCRLAYTSLVSSLFDRSFSKDIRRRGFPDVFRVQRDT